MSKWDLRTTDGRWLGTYDTAPGDKGRLAVVWLSGTPGLGVPPVALCAAGEHMGIRWIGFDRPGYGCSTPKPGRVVADVARDLTAVVNAAGVDKFAVMGHSVGGSFALGAGALLGDRVGAVATLAAVAPRDASGLEWHAGMHPSRVASLEAAAAGRDMRTLHEATGEGLEYLFTPAELELLDGRWEWLRSEPEESWIDGLVDDDISLVTPWGCDPADIRGQVLLSHGSEDEVVPPSHSQWLASRIQATSGRANLELHPGRNHLSILAHAASALEWVRSQTG